jgi:hypothetical protein
MKKSVRRRASRNSRTLKTSAHLQLSQPLHTGHVLPRRNTSYPTLAMILLVVGVFMAGWTHFATADSGGSYVVTASVIGPPPPGPATIDSPSDGTTVSVQPITVSGRCPLDTYETLYRNGAFSGVALCDGSGHYSLQTGLFPGVNLLQVRDFNTTDVAGPLSNSVNVTYQPLSGLPPNNTSTSLSEPLIFKTTYRYEAYYIGQPTTWQLDLEGGKAPYSITVDWGDGSHSLISRPAAGVFSTTHTYQKASPYKGSYAVTFSASDSQGQQTFLQLMTIIKNTVVATGTTSHRQSSSGNLLGAAPLWLQELTHYVWPLYLLILLMLISFWLGERREYYHLRPQLRKNGRA